MRALRLALVLALLVLGLWPMLARAAGPFALPGVTLANPMCAIFDADCSLSTGPGAVSTSFGAFRLDVHGDLVNAELAPSGNGWCMPLSGSSTLTFGSGPDQLALAGGTLCYTQPADAAGLPSPLSGPWPLRLTFTVDPVASTGLYVGSSGNGTIDGTWTTQQNCADDGSGNPVSLCGLSGEPLASFTLTSLNIPDLTIPGTGCTTGCGGGGGGGGGNPIPNETPEVESVAMFASGLFGLGGYVLLRRRARGSA